MGLIVDVLSPDAPRDLEFSFTGVVEYEPDRPGDPEWEEREHARLVAACTTLAGFLKYVWPAINPGRSFIWGRHLDIVCYALEQLAYGRIENNELVICIPPRHLKSITVSVAFTGWLWLRAPWVQTLGIASAEKVAVRDTAATRTLVKSERYQRLLAFAKKFFGPSGYEGDWEVVKHQDQKMKFENTAGGVRAGLAAGAKITGEGADLLIVDDPLDAKEATEGSPDAIAAFMEVVKDRYGGTWDSRLNDPDKSIKVVIMQRLHEADLAGVLLDRGVVSVVLPTEFNPDHPHICMWDWRTERGELLFPERLSIRKIKQMRGCPEEGIPATWTAEAYAAQHDQLPNPAGGGLFPTDLWRRFVGAPLKIWNDCKKSGGLTMASYDCANTQGERAANSSIGLLCRPPGMKSLKVIHAVVGQYELPGLVAEFDRIDREFAPRVHVIEFAGNGIGLYQMKRHTHNVYPIKPKEFGSKEDRAQFTKTYLIAQNLELPEDHFASWAPRLIHEHAMFPNGRFADQVDMLSQACIYAETIEPVSGRGASSLTEAVKELVTRIRKDSDEVGDALKDALNLY